MSAQKYLQELCSEHKMWKNKLAFYADDLRIMKTRLGEVSAKYTDTNIRVMVERFENKMIIQKEQIDIIKHDINKSQLRIQDDFELNPTAADHRKTADDADLRDKVNTFELLFNALRKDLLAFTARWM